MAKRMSIYVMSVAEAHEVLGEIADMIIATYALDSLVARVAQLITQGDAARSEIACHLLHAYAPNAFDQVKHTARDVLMEISGDPSPLDAVSGLAVRFPGKTIAAKRALADAVVAARGWPL